MVLGMKTVLNQRWLRPDLLCFLSSLSSLVLCAAWDEVFLTSLIPRYAEIMRKCGEYHGDINMVHVKYLDKLWPMHQFVSYSVLLREINMVSIVFMVK